MSSTEHPVIIAARLARSVAAWSCPGTDITAADPYLAQAADAASRDDMVTVLQALHQASAHLSTLQPVCAGLSIVMRAKQVGS